MGPPKQLTPSLKKTSSTSCAVFSSNRVGSLMENLATDLAKNAMMHNLAIELLRKQFQQMDMALKEKVV